MTTKKYFCGHRKHIYELVEEPKKITQQNFYGQISN